MPAIIIIIIIMYLQTEVAQLPTDWEKKGRKEGGRKEKKDKATQTN